MANENEIAPEELAEAEAEAAPEETPVSQPEAEPGEGAEEAPQPEPDAPTAAEAENEARCPAEMGWYRSPRCGRKLHPAHGADEQPVCLMHSKDPNKQSGLLFDAFWLEFERTLEESGEFEAHFDHFVFPHFEFSKREFQATCLFSGAIFTEDSDFRGATFTKNCDFAKATFKKGAIFFKTTFEKRAIFFNATFTQVADFDDVTFMQDLNFTGATFMQNARFGKAIFKEKAEFSANFMRDADFSDANFMKDADFSDAIFAQNAVFDSATFEQQADFLYVTFTQSVRFEHTRFNGTVKWKGCRFLDQAHFRDTLFDPKIPGKPSAVFELAHFSKPMEIVFDNVDLSRAIFYNCDVSQISFTSSVQWGKRQNKHGLAVFEETFIDTLPLDDVALRIIDWSGQRDYRAVAQIYQQLKKNYDSRLDYWTANDFHFGEMEMKRLAIPIDGRFFRLRQWWHRNLSFVAWYRYASDYGNSYAKPGVWLIAILMAAMLAFPVTGLELKQPKSGNSASNAIVTYQSIWNRQDSWANNLWTEGKLVIKSGITAIDTATFQRNSEYTPAYPRGRILGILETLLTSSLFALFLLAIRRQFRR